MSATALLKNNPKPSAAQIKTAINGNLCRCGTYVNALVAIQAAAESL